MEKEPTVIHLYPTMRCQLNCKYCYVDSVNKDIEELSLDHYENLIKQSMAMGISTFDIAGGEPFLFEHIIELLRLIKKYGGITKVVSNGYYLDRYISLLEREKLIDELHISLDSVIPEIHDSTRGCQGLFQKVTENISLFQEKNVGKLKVNYVLQQGTYQELEDMLNFLNKEKVTGIDIQYVEDVGEKTKSGSYALSISELMNSVERIINWKENNEAKLNILLALPSYVYSIFTSELRKRIKVSGIQVIFFPGLLQNNYFSHAIIVRHNGDITGATAFFNDKKWICGNIKETPLKTIVEIGFAKKKKELEKLIDDRMEVSCTGCISARFCHGAQLMQENSKCFIKVELLNFINKGE